MDKMAVRTKVLFAPLLLYISDELLPEVVSLLYFGIHVEAIIQRHTEMAKGKGDHQIVMILMPKDILGGWKGKYNIFLCT
jgi:hypothetical protein